MSWQHVKLGDIADIIMGQSPKSEYFNTQGEGMPFMQGKTEFGELYPTIVKHTTYTTRVAKKNSILFTVRAPVGSLNIANQDICIGRGLASIDSKNEDNSFLYYLIKNSYKMFMSESGEGVYDSINRTNLTKVKLLVPDEPKERYKIGAILKCYDDLIANNLKRINLLEQAAQNIYQEWFVNMRFPGHESAEFDSVNGLPEGWKRELLSNQLKTIKRKGKLKKDKYLINGKYPVIDQSNSIIGGYSENKELVHFEPLPMVIFGDHTRRVKYVDFPFISGADGTQLLYPKNEELLPAYFYWAIKNIDLSNYHYARHFKFLKQNSILIPDKNTLESFNNNIEPFLKKITLLNNYNSKLKEARDILLPRLMNQTIEV